MHAAKTEVVNRIPLPKINILNPLLCCIYEGLSGYSRSAYMCRWHHTKARQIWRTLVPPVTIAVFPSSDHRARRSAPKVVTWYRSGDNGDPTTPPTLPPAKTKTNTYRYRNSVLRDSRPEDIIITIDDRWSVDLCAQGASQGTRRRHNERLPYLTRIIAMQPGAVNALLTAALMLTGGTREISVELGFVREPRAQACTRRSYCAEFDGTLSSLSKQNPGCPMNLNGYYGHSRPITLLLSAFCKAKRCVATHWVS